MRRCSIHLCAVLAAVAYAITAPAPAAAAGNSCRAESLKSGNTVTVANRTGVIFESRRLQQTVACTYKHRRLVKLRGVCCQFARFQLGSRYLGFSYRLDEAFNEVDEMGVFDLKTGKRVPFSKQSGPATVDTGGYVESFQVTAKGGLVWVQGFKNGDDEPDPNDVAVRTIARGETPQTLDRGKIDPDSFAVSSGGKTVYWSNDGTVKSAPIG
ncbi:MAG TPA: hypothetical protein VF517_16755 [Thermoleophilaceae bacterium]